MQKNSLFFLTACLLILSIMLGGCTNLQGKTVATTKKYPDKPITFIVPFGVGGGTDLVARLLEKTAPTHLGQSLVIINKPGASGTLGWNELSSASPDGYTIGITGTELLLQPLYGPAKYNYPTALEPLAQIVSLSMVMAVKSEQPWQNVDDLVMYAKQHPGKIKYGHTGVGGLGHVAGEAFAKTANIHLEQVPFQSGAEATASLLGGHVQVVFLNPASIKEHLKSGMVKVLAVSGEQRLTDPVYTTVPTFKEQGFNVVYDNWYAIAAPKGLPPEVKSKLVDGLKAMINDPEFKRNIEQLGLQISYLGPKESEEIWLTDSEKLAKTVEETGILDNIKEQKK
jgi:tripartite-type tricarboxylate transporter receptor subunit TctC